MSLNGIWVLEIAGVFGWERVSTVFLEKGRYLGGGAIFFTQGSYVKKKNIVEFNLEITRHNNKDKTVIYGEVRKQFRIIMKGKVKQDKIIGVMSLEGAKSTVAKYHVQLLRKSDLPKIPK